MLKDKELQSLIDHYSTFLGGIEEMEFTPSKNMPLKPKLVLSKANKYRPYNVVATVGMSEVKLNGTYSNCELMVLLDEKWKFNNNPAYQWPFELLNKIANAVCLSESEFGYGQYFINDGDKPFGPLTDMGVALIAVPAMFDRHFFELKSGKKTTNFFILTMATFEELKLIKRMGGITFIQRYLLPEGEDAFIIHNNKLG